MQPRPQLPIFQGDGTVLKKLRLPQPCFSAALTAQVKANCNDVGEKNGLCATVPFQRRLDEYPGATAASLRNQVQWVQNKALRPGIHDSRLDGFGKPISRIDLQDAEKRAIAARLWEWAKVTMVNMDRLVGESD